MSTAMFFFMNYVVLPLAAGASAPFSLGMLLNGVFGNALFVACPSLSSPDAPEAMVALTTLSSGQRWQLTTSHQPNKEKTHENT
jgi:hypothetical protein